MDNIEKNILDISHNYYKYLLNLQNVNGIGLGHKKINGIVTNELCLNVFVEKKLEKNHLSKINIIPKNYMGIKTDVIKIGKLSKKFLINSKFKPLVGGIGISPIDTYGFNVAGTLGCIVVKKNFSIKQKYFILSNNHVLSCLNQLPLGTPVIQPSLHSGGKNPNDIVARLYNFIPIRLSTSSSIEVNYVDCAIAEISNKSLLSKEIYSVGKIKGISQATLDLPVKKVGFVTGLTTGIVSSTGVTYEFKVGNKFEIYEDQFLCDMTSSNGDSGSIVLNNQNQAVGLLMGGADDGSISIFNDISTVLNSLKIKIYT